MINIDDRWNFCKIEHFQQTNVERKKERRKLHIYTVGNLRFDHFLSQISSWSNKNICLIYRLSRLNLLSICPKKDELYYCSKWLYFLNFNSCINDVANAGISLKIGAQRKVYVLFFYENDSSLLLSTLKTDLLINSFYMSPTLRHWLSPHCLFPWSQLCDICTHCTLLK